MAGDRTAQGAAAGSGIGLTALVGCRRSAADRDLLTDLATQLEAAGVPAVDLVNTPTLAHLAALSAVRQVVVLLTPAAADSELVGYLLELLLKSLPAPRLVVVSCAETALPGAFGAIQLWGRVQWDGGAAAELARAVVAALTPDSPGGVGHHSGGGVPIGSPYYVERATDRAMGVAVEQRESIVLVSGPRQIGKTSLLARGLDLARRLGQAAAYTDFQSLNVDDLASLESFYCSVADLLADALEVDGVLAAEWEPRRSPNLNFERFLKRRLLRSIDRHLVWAIDEADRLFRTAFGSEVFALFRSWHNARALDPTGPWHQLTLLIGYASDASQLILDHNQSPFNVGHRIPLDDFGAEQWVELNARFGGPLGEGELERLVRLIGGVPVLWHDGLRWLVEQGCDLDRLLALAEDEQGPYGAHLVRLLAAVRAEAALEAAVRAMLAQRPPAEPDGLHLLLRAGLVRPDGAAGLRWRCELYRRYLAENLL